MGWVSAWPLQLSSAPALPPPATWPIQLSFVISGDDIIWLGDDIIKNLSKCWV